jgi:flagellar motor protein MotB
VAHADFMTAMMAFFLIMWLINVTDDQMRKGISQYFNPIHLSEGSTELKGLNAPSDDPERPATRKATPTTPAPAPTIRTPSIP